MLANRTAGATIMATVASFAHDFRPIVVDKSIGEIDCIVACTAILGCAAVDFGVRHAPGSRAHMICAAIMTRGAIACDTRVIEYCRYKRIVRVADVAILGCG